MTLTLARMHPATDDRGIARVTSYEHRTFTSSAVTASNPMVLPSVPLTEDKRVDYLLFLHEVQYEEYNGYPLIEHIEGRKQKKARFQCQLTYKELEGSLERKCRVSEPFLSSILAALRDRLFRSGAPDFPNEETARLRNTGLFTQ